MKTKLGKIGYGRKPTVRQISNAWRERRSKATQIEMNKATTMQSGLTTALNNQIAGRAALAAQAGVNRVNAATDALKKSAQSIDISV